MERPERLLVECDRCEAKVNAEYIAQYEAFDEDDRLPYRYYFCRCPSCDDPFVAISCNYGDPDDESHWESPSRYLPRPERDLHAFPKSITAAYNEARRCFRCRAYTATAVMCRKTVEGICAEHSVAERNLAASLQKMRDSGVIDARLFQWAEELRLSGNEAAHGVEVTFSQEDAQDILEFTRALLEYIFTFRERFERFQQRRLKREAKNDPELTGNAAGNSAEENIALS